MPGRGLNLLSLDGGGIRGLSSLQILKQLMEGVARERDWDEPPKPCEFFDMIGGTSTGGLIAIMLGRMELSIDECIEAYIELSSIVFTRKHLLPVSATGKIKARFDSATLEGSVKTVLKRYGFKEDELLKNFGESKCKVFVCATSTDITKTVLLTSYRSLRSDSDRLKYVQVWQAARATSAASTFFEPITIPLGSYKETFVDGATGANNPVLQCWSEATDVWMKGDARLEDNLDCLVSIGTGVPSLEPFGESLKGLGETLIYISTETEDTAENFQRAHLQLSQSGRYCRLNVLNGLQNIGLEEVEKRDFIMSTTKHYLQSQDVLNLMSKSIEKLAEHEYLHRALIRRDQWSLAIPENNRSIYHLLEAISSYNHVLVQSSLNEKRIPGTAQWILKHPAFEGWLTDSTARSFYCSGIVGSGKTMITTAVVESLLRQNQGQEKAIVCYYLDPQVRGSLTSSSLIRSFIKQLVMFCGIMSIAISHQARKRLENTFGTVASSPPDSVLTSIFLEIAQIIPAAFCVIDGLHELAESEVSKALHFIEELHQSTTIKSLKILLIARDNLGHNINIRRRLKNITVLELSLELLSQDIETFVDMSTDRKMNHDRPITQNQQLFKDLKSNLKKEGQKMFLWIHLQILSLWKNCATDQEVKAAINNFPEGLDETYVRCLERIHQNKIHRRLAPKVFKWIAFAKRPLQIPELQEAISLTLDDKRWDGEKAVNIAIPDICANLIEIDPTNRSLQFIHPSVRQFLLSGLPRIFNRYGLDPGVDKKLCGDLCLTYLSFSDFALQVQQHSTTPVQFPVQQITDRVLGNWPMIGLMTGMLHRQPQRKTEHVVQASVRAPVAQHVRDNKDIAKFRFLRYARKHWPAHTLALNVTFSKWEEFESLATTPNVSYKLQPWVSEGMNKSIYARHLLAFAVKTGHRPLLIVLIESRLSNEMAGNFLDQRLPESDLKPVHVAAALGHFMVLSYLLVFGCQVSALDSNGNTALHFAASGDHLDCVRVLVSKGASPICKNQDNQTPLSLAARDGSIETLAVFLSTEQITSTFATLARNQKAALIERQVRFNVGAACKEAAIEAARNGRADAMELLLKTELVSLGDESDIRSLLLELSLSYE